MGKALEDGEVDVWNITGFRYTDSGKYWSSDGDGGPVAAKTCLLFEVSDGVVRGFTTQRACDLEIRRWKNHISFLLLDGILRKNYWTWVFRHFKGKINK